MLCFSCTGRFAIQRFWELFDAVERFQSVSGRESHTVFEGDQRVYPQVMIRHPIDEIVSEGALSQGEIAITTHVIYDYDVCDICYMDDRMGIRPTCCKENNFICLQCYVRYINSVRSTMEKNFKVLSVSQIVDDHLESITDCPFCRQRVILRFNGLHKS
jgi:hypothetical protein